MNPLRDFKDAVITAIKPGANTTKTMRKGKALKFYYRISIIPLIINIILVLLFNVSNSQFATSINSLTGALQTLTQVSGGYGLQNLQNLLSGLVSLVSDRVLVVVLVVLKFWIIFPIMMFLNAGILHIFGKRVFGAFDNGYVNTMSATLYSIIPLFAFGWLTTSPSIVGPVSLLLLVWSVFIYTVALANQQKLTKKKAFAIIFGTGFVLTVLLLVVMPFIAMFLHELIGSSLYSGIGEI